MPPWIIKAGIQGALSRLPDPQRFNRLFQKYVTRSLDLADDYFLYKWSQCDRQVRDYFRLRPDADPGFSVLELGTGWFPITPIGYALNGARRAYSIDMQDLLAHESVVDTLRAYARMLDDGRIEVRDPTARDRLRGVLNQAHRLSARELLDAIGVEAVIADARRSGLPDRSVDLIGSNNTLEHIPREVIEGIFVEFERLLSEGGLMVHFIDMADHYANFDHGISDYNFLKFSDRAWSLFNNDLQYLNRLRVSDFREIHAAAGFRLLEEVNTGDESLLDGITLAPEFQHYARADLVPVTTWMVSEAAAT
ncbi:MAG: class I SAM-dependent methyltransferase [Myxococcales bacterium]|nr:class I SAM-dependent methyltransferase [Myxococcales bacterium]